MKEQYDQIMLYERLTMVVILTAMALTTVWLLYFLRS